MRHLLTATATTGATAGLIAAEVLANYPDGDGAPAFSIPLNAFSEVDMQAMHKALAEGWDIEIDGYVMSMNGNDPTLVDVSLVEGLLPEMPRLGLADLDLDDLTGDKIVHLLVVTMNDAKDNAALQLRRRVHAGNKGKRNRGGRGKGVFHSAGGLGELTMISGDYKPAKGRVYNGRNPLAPTMVRGGMLN